MKQKTRKEIVREVASERHQLEMDGETRVCTTLELVTLKLFERAVKGGHQGAQKEIQRLLEQYKPERTGGTCGILLVPAELSPEEFMEKIRERDDRMIRQKENMTSLI